MQSKSMKRKGWVKVASEYIESVYLLSGLSCHGLSGNPVCKMKLIHLHSHLWVSRESPVLSGQTPSILLSNCQCFLGLGITGYSRRSHFRWSVHMLSGYHLCCCAPNNLIVTKRNCRIVTKSLYRFTVYQQA